MALKCLACRVESKNILNKLYGARHCKTPIKSHVRKRRTITLASVVATPVPAIFQRNASFHMTTFWLGHGWFLRSQTRYMASSNCSTSKHESSPIKLVIFDKDGTLVCFHTMWGPWCREIALELQKQTGLQVTEDVYGVLNYDPTTGRIGRGSLAEKTSEDMLEEMRVMLKQQHSLAHDHAHQVVKETCYVDDPESLAVKPTCDVKLVFETLREANIKIAVCTSDDRETTEVALRAMGLMDMIDYMVCGNDCESVTKPAPDNVHLICSQLGVDPKHTVVIGDTPSDTEMGKRSGVGLVVGVLSGVCTVEDLEPHADVVLDDVEKALPIILNPTLLSSSGSEET